MKRDEMKEEIRVRMGMGAIEKIKEALEIINDLPPSSAKTQLIEQTEKALKEAQEHLA
jgi:hypothetical protein|tara:strand:+ start:36 stop:209 length:174 start_codon:yes stop_codon:yes gene_type:complete